MVELMKNKMLILMSVNQAICSLKPKTIFDKMCLSFFNFTMFIFNKYVIVGKNVIR